MLERELDFVEALLKVRHVELSPHHSRPTHPMARGRKCGVSDLPPPKQSLLVSTLAPESKREFLANLDSGNPTALAAFAASPRLTSPTPTFVSPSLTARLVEECGLTDNVELDGAAAFLLRLAHITALAPPNSPSKPRRSVFEFLSARSVLASKSFLLIPAISPTSLAPALNDPDPPAALHLLFPPPPPSRKAKSRVTSARHYAKAASDRNEKSVNEAWVRGDLITTLSGDRKTPTPAAALAAFHPSLPASPSTPHLALDRAAMASAFAKIQVMLLVAAVVDGLPLSLVTAPVTTASLPQTHGAATATTDLLAALTPAITMGDLAPLALYRASLATTRPSFQALLRLISPDGAAEDSLGSRPHRLTALATFSSILIPVYAEAEQEWSLARLVPDDTASPSTSAPMFQIYEYDTRFTADEPPSHPPAPPHAHAHLRSPPTSPQASETESGATLTLLYTLALGVGNADALCGTGWWSHLRGGANPSSPTADPSALASLRSTLTTVLGLHPALPVPSLDAVFPRPTSDDDAAVDAALAAAETDIVCVATTDCPVVLTGRDFHTLAPGAWLNDEILNAFLATLRTRASAVNVWITNTFFYAKLYDNRTGYDYAAVETWTKNVDVASLSKVLVPAHLNGNHWALVVIDYKSRQIASYDAKYVTLGTIAAKQLRRWVVDEAKSRGADVVDPQDWAIVVRTDAPLQDNLYDCGVFTLAFAACVVLGLPITTVSQRDTPRLRRSIAASILSHSSPAPHKRKRSKSQTPSSATKRRKPLDSKRRE